LCDLELEREGVSYTVDTLRILRANHPGWSLFLILGQDLLAGFASWKEPEAIAGLAELVAILRTGGMEPVGEGAGARILRMEPIDISSSRIRSSVARGKAVSDMVVPGVMSIMESERLYGGWPAAEGETVSRTEAGGRAEPVGRDE